MLKLLAPLLLWLFETYAAAWPKAPEAALVLLSPQLRAACEQTWQAIQGAPIGKA